MTTDAAPQVCVAALHVHRSGVMHRTARSSARPRARRPTGPLALLQRLLDPGSRDDSRPRGRRGSPPDLSAQELPTYYPAEPRFAPDLLVVLDVEDVDRDKWVVSAEGKGLDWALELHVGGDRKKDAERNVARYERLGIPSTSSTIALATGSRHFVWRHPMRASTPHRPEPRPVRVAGGRPPSGREKIDDDRAPGASDLRAAPRSRLRPGPHACSRPQRSSNCWPTERSRATPCRGAHRHDSWALGATRDRSACTSRRVPPGSRCPIFWG